MKTTINSGWEEVECIVEDKREEKFVAEKSVVNQLLNSKSKYLCKTFKHSGEATIATTEFRKAINSMHYEAVVKVRKRGCKVYLEKTEDVRVKDIGQKTPIFGN